MSPCRTLEGLNGKKCELLHTSAVVQKMQGGQKFHGMFGGFGQTRRSGVVCGNNSDFCVRIRSLSAFSFVGLLAAPARPGLSLLSVCRDERHQRFAAGCSPSVIAPASLRSFLMRPLLRMVYRPSGVSIS